MKKTIGILSAVVLLLCGFAGCSADPDGSLLIDTGDYSSFCCTDGEWVYYSQLKEIIEDESVKSIWKARLDGSEGQELLKANALSLWVEGEWLYFKEDNWNEKGYWDSSEVKRVRTDGSEVETLFTEGDEILGRMTVRDGWIYFSKGVYYQDGDSDYKLYRMRTDGSGLTALVAIHELDQFHVTDDAIYYVGATGNTLERMEPDGSEKEVLTELTGDVARSDCPYVWDEKVYYYALEDSWYYWDLKTSKSEKLPITPEADIKGIYNGWIYYTVSFEGLYRCRQDGSDLQLLAKDAETLLGYKGWAFIARAEEDGGIYILNSDSGKRVKLPSSEMLD